MSGELTEFLLKADFLNDRKQLETTYINSICKISHSSYVNGITKPCKVTNFC